MNWLSQIFTVISFTLRTIPQRRGAAIAAAFGIAGVVGVLVGVLAIAEGFRQTMTASATPDVAIVLRSGADNEMNSGLSREETRIISTAPGIAQGPNGPLTSSELFVVISLPKITTGTDANVPLRGVEPNAFAVRSSIKLVEGRRFEPGKNEIIVGVGASRVFAGLELGKQIKVGPNLWHVVGLFTAAGGAEESEIWTDAAVLQPAYQRADSFQSMFVKLASPESFTEFKDFLTTNPQVKTKTSKLSDYYLDQSSQLSDFITTIGVFIASLMALGALFGALNTMYGAVAARTREIATLRALGFSSGPVVVSVLAESITLALVGGVFGATVAYLAFNGYQASTLNWASFSQVTFRFAVTPALLTQAIFFAAVLGVLGGLLPAFRAARMPIAQALRET